MGFYLNPPADGFQNALNTGLYVDKSGLIAYTNSVLESDRKLTCVSRPRRFGKSFAAKMSQFLVGAYITGILPIKKYRTQSALTDFKEFTMLNRSVPDTWVTGSIYTQRGSTAGIYSGNQTWKSTGACKGGASI